MSQGRETMVTDTTIPTLATARNAYGLTTSKALIAKHLQELASAMGVTATAKSVDAIAEDILSGYGDLRATELILAFKLMREGKFRDGANQERDSCQFYGTLSSQVICNCLYRYRFEYRNPILQREEQKRHRRKVEEELQQAATPEKRNQAIMATCLNQLQVPQLLSIYLTKKEMNDLQYFVEERKMHLLLRQRVKDFLAGKAEASALEKAIAYLEINYPVSNGNDNNAQP